MLTVSLTTTVLAAATTIAIGAVVVIPPGDIQVKVSERFLIPTKNPSHTPPSLLRPEDVFVCESRVLGCALLRSSEAISSLLSCPTSPRTGSLSGEGQSVSPQLCLDVSSRNS